MKTIVHNKRNHKVFTYSTEFGNYDVILVEEEYNLGGLAIQALCVENDMVTEPFTTITVCLCPMDAMDKVAFVDTNNNPDAEKFIRENKLGKNTGRRASSGFCTYPLYEFDVTKFYAEA